MKIVGPAPVIKKPVAPRPRTAIPAPAPALRNAPLVEPPTLTGVGATTPDYQALIKADPGYLAFENAKNSGLASAGANRAAAIKALILRFGGIPNGFKDAFGDVSQADLTAASGNQNSITAQLKRGFDTAQQQMRQSLAARGMLQSGDLDYGQGQLDQQLSQQQYDQGNQFIDALQQALQGYTGTVNDYGTQEAGAISDAQNRVQQLYLPTAGTNASYVPGSAEKYGMPVYKDANGKLWKPGVNGPEPFAPPAPAPAVPVTHSAVAAPAIPRPVAPILRRQPA